jgi:hypothetical protein
MQAIARTVERQECVLDKPGDETADFGQQAPQP